MWAWECGDCFDSMGVIPVLFFLLTKFDLGFTIKLRNYKEEDKGWIKK